ncbi:MAG: N-acetylmuramoyl-L-alanine amidase [Aphanocapsa sp. GSE-SYN-MK-11-07L]|nr:N-acetylmuramoyl-L-alanine amidase [Aphanocapsa sp. GSE-SYN-MK-11-07L]
MVSANSPDWDATVSSLGGVVIIPRGGASAIPRNNAPQNTYSLLTGASFAQSTPPPVAGNNFSTIQDIDVGSNQLLIRADRLSSYTIRWEGRSYRITLRSTQLSDQLQPPRLGAGSPLEDIQLQQIDPQTVSVLLTPAPGVRLIGPRPLDSQSLLVQLYRAGSPIPPPVNPRNPTVTQIPTSPQFPASPPIQTPVEPPPIRNTSGRRVVVIDPGHGGPDPGAIGIGGIREKDLVLDMSLEIARVLQQQGVIVRLTRPDDRDLDLAPRVAIAERANAAVFVSIHANAVSLARPDINGVETFAAPGRPRSRQLATLIQNSILARFNMVDRGVKIARFYVIRNTSMPSALVETGFVTGANDARNLADPTWRKEMAQAIARGILQYLQSGR